jgi:hypothetical protein
MTTVRQRKTAVGNDDHDHDHVELDTFIVPNFTVKDLLSVIP